MIITHLGQAKERGEGERGQLTGFCTFPSRRKHGFGEGMTLRGHVDSCICRDTGEQDTSLTSLAPPPAFGLWLGRWKASLVAPAPTSLPSLLQLPSFFKNLSGPVCWSFQFNTF